MQAGASYGGKASFVQACICTFEWDWAALPSGNSITAWPRTVSGQTGCGLAHHRASHSQTWWRQ